MAGAQCYAFASLDQLIFSYCTSIGRCNQMEYKCKSNQRWQWYGMVSISVAHALASLLNNPLVGEHYPMQVNGTNEHNATLSSAIVAKLQLQSCNLSKQSTLLSIWPWFLVATNTRHSAWILAVQHWYASVLVFKLADGTPRLWYGNGMGWWDTTPMVW